MVPNLKMTDSASKRDSSYPGFDQTTECSPVGEHSDTSADDTARVVGTSPLPPLRPLTQSVEGARDPSIRRPADTRISLPRLPPGTEPLPRPPFALWCRRAGSLTIRSL